MQLMLFLLMIYHNGYDEVIGIDFGSTTSCAGIFDNGKVNIIKNELGNTNTPSFISIVGNDIWNGERAKQQMIPNPNNTFYSIKKLIGFNNDDNITNYPFQIVKTNDTLNIKQYNSDKTFTLDYITSVILNGLKEMTQNSIGREVKRAVIAVPAYFNENQTNVIREAGSKAGFRAIKIVKEPNAAAIAYGLNKNYSQKQKILVFHLGGFTLDVSLLSIEESFIKVLDSQVDNDVCGENFNNRIIDYFLQSLDEISRKNVYNNYNCIQKLKNEAEKAKKILSKRPKTIIMVDDFPNDIFLTNKITREKFEEINDDLFQKSINLITEVLKKSNITKNEINEIILVGGSTKIPKIQKMISDFFDGKKLLSHINPEEVVAYGASLLAGCLSGNLNARDSISINPYSFSIKTNSDEKAIIIHENTYLPIVQIKRFNFSNKYQNHFNAEIYISSSDDEFESLYIEEFIMTDIKPNEDDIFIIDVSLEFTVDFILKVTAKNINEEKSIEINIENERHYDSFDYYENMVSKKAQEINDEFIDKLNELIELRKNCISQVKWFLVQILEDDENIYQRDPKPLQVLIDHFREIFHEMNDIHSKSKWEEPPNHWEYDDIDF